MNTDYWDTQSHYLTQQTTPFGEVTCDGLASRPREVEILLAAYATETGISSGSYEPALAPRLKKNYTFAVILILTRSSHFGKQIISFAMPLGWRMSISYDTIKQVMNTETCLCCSDSILKNHFMSRIIRCPKDGHHHKQTNLMFLIHSCDITETIFSFRALTANQPHEA